MSMLKGAVLTSRKIFLSFGMATAGPRRCLRWVWREKKWRISSEGLIRTRVVSWISRTGLPGVSGNTISKKFYEYDIDVVNLLSLCSLWYLQLS